MDSVMTIRLSAFSFSSTIGPVRVKFKREILSGQKIRNFNLVPNTPFQSDYKYHWFYGSVA